MYRVVGVVGNVRHASLAQNPSDAVYVTLGQSPYADQIASMVVRTESEPASFAAPIRQAIWSVDKDQAIARVTTMDVIVAQSAAERRFALVLIEAFAVTVQRTRRSTLLAKHEG